MNARQGKRRHTNMPYLHSHSSWLRPLAALLLRLAEVVAEVVVARRFGNGGSAVRDGNVLQVQEAELDLHGQEDLQLAAHGFAAHLPTQEDAQPVRPQAELTDRTAHGYKWIYKQNVFYEEIQSFSLL